MNALPIAPVHSRPCLRLFFCGATDSNQHGFGSDAPSLGCPKLKRNTKVEASGEAGTYGDAGAGPEIIAAGGLHTLFVDEEGRVRCALHFSCHTSLAHVL
jgi:regulator of chromosome condensation